MEYVIKIKVQTNKQIQSVYTVHVLVIKECSVCIYRSLNLIYV